MIALGNKAEYLPARMEIVGAALTSPQYDSARPEVTGFIKQAGEKRHIVPKRHYHRPAMRACAEFFSSLPGAARRTPRRENPKAEHSRK